MSKNLHPSRIIVCNVSGYTGLRMENSSISLIVIPDLGGKIVSFKSISTQHEWLWKNPYFPYQIATTTDSYTEHHDTGGIDECFPTVDACTLPVSAGRYSGIKMPDHGELYARPWKTEASTVDTKGNAIVILKRECTSLPFEFKRELILSPNDGMLKIRYQLKNHSKNTVPFSWCLHPALRFEPGMKILLPHGHQLRCSYASTDAPIDTGEVFRWPLTVSGQDLSQNLRPKIRAGFAAKLLSATHLNDVITDGTTATVGLENPTTRQKLLFTLSPDQTPHIALWLNRCGWAPEGITPYSNLVLEPAIGNADSLATLIERGTAPSVAAKQTRCWELSLSISDID